MHDDIAMTTLPVCSSATSFSMITDLDDFGFVMQGARHLFAAVATPVDQ